MSTRKRRNSSARRPSIGKNRYEPTDDDVDSCEWRMEMSELRKTQVYLEVMPKSFDINGRQVPKSQLRKRELCREYLRYGGTVGERKRKALKHWKPPRKISQEERQEARLALQRSRDHNGSKKKSSQRRTSVKRPSSSKKTSTRRPSLNREPSTAKRGSSKRASLTRSRDRTDSIERHMRNLRMHTREEEPSEEEYEDAEQPDVPESDELEEEEDVY